MSEVKRTSDEIQRDIERVRDSLVRDVGALEATVRDKLDWRKPIRERPVQAVGAAFVVGLLIAML